MHKEPAGRTIEANSHRLSTSAFERGVGGVYWAKGEALRLHHRGQRDKSFLVVSVFSVVNHFLSSSGEDSYSLPVLSSPGTWPSNNSLVLSAARSRAFISARCSRASPFRKGSSRQMI
mgnify:CR=1 FL=1